MKALLHALAAIAMASCLCAVEVRAEVVSVTDGDTIVVSVAGTQERIRLLYLDTPESRGNSHGAATPEGKLAAEFLDLLAKAGAAVTLWGPGAELERDRYQRILAVVITSRGDTLQERVVAAGWSPVWEKFGKADPRWRQTLVDAEEKAKRDKAGAWATDPGYMTDKGNETTAKQRE